MSKPNVCRIVVQKAFTKWQNMQRKMVKQRRRRQSCDIVCEQQRTGHFHTHLKNGKLLRQKLCLNTNIEEN